MGSGINRIFTIYEGTDHKVHIYLEYHSVCPLVRIGTLPPNLTQECVPPRNLRGGYICLRVRGWGVPIRTTGDKA